MTLVMGVWLFLGDENRKACTDIINRFYLPISSRVEITIKKSLTM